MVQTFFYRVFCGFFLGLSVVAPGFSGSVIAIIMGIYHDLVRIASNPLKRFRQNVVFCLPLAVGAAVSAVLFILFFKYLFDTYEKATYLLFVGLVAGNLPVIFAEVKKYGFRLSYGIGGVCAFAVALACGMIAMRAVAVSGGEGVSVWLPLFAIGGLAAGAAAPVPGLSVSMVLIMIGIYSPIITAAEALLHFDLTYAVHFGMFAVCAVAGIVLASRVIKSVFDKVPGFANTAVLGFMAGSLVGILVQSTQLSDVNFHWLLGAGALAAGLAISMLFVMLGRRMGKSARSEGDS